MEKNILLVGVGGQGTLLVSKILSEGLMEAGYDVKMSEIHGMSQRGGSVSTHIKFGKKVNSPVIAEGEAAIMDSLLSLVNEVFKLMLLEHIFNCCIELVFELS